MSNKNEVMTPMEYFKGKRTADEFAHFVPTPEDIEDYAQYYHSAMIQKSEGMSAQEWAKQHNPIISELKPLTEELMNGFAAYKLQAGKVDIEQLRAEWVKTYAYGKEDANFIFDWFKSRLSAMSADGVHVDEKENFNNKVRKEDWDKWHKVDKSNFTPPPTSTNIVFFTESGSVFCGHYKSSVGFICYGIGAKELTDVEVTHWRILTNPAEYQKILDDMDIL